MPEWALVLAGPGLMGPTQTCPNLRSQAEDPGEGRGSPTGLTGCCRHPWAVQGGQGLRKTSPTPSSTWETRGDQPRPVLGRTSCAEPMLTPPRGQSPGRGGQHGLPSVHRRGRDWSSRHDVGPAGHCSGDPSRGTLPIPQGAQRVGKVGAGGGWRRARGDALSRGRDGRGWGGEDLGLAAVHLRVRGCLEVR